MVTLSQQLQLHIFLRCFPVLRGGSDGPIPVKGEDTFNISCRSLLPFLKMRWISHICSAMLTFNSAKPAPSHSGSHFSLSFEMCRKKKTNPRRHLRK